MPDYYGNPTEEELRNSQTGYAPPIQTASSQPNLIFDGTIGTRHVQLYGEGPPLSQEQAFAYVAKNSEEESRNGAMPVSQWRALHPNATAAELSAYKRLNTAYTAQTAGQGIGTKIGNAVAFEVDRAGNLIKNVAHDPSRLLTGVDPLSTQISNTVTGSDNKPLVGQFGGATTEDFDRYERSHGFGSLGAARELSHSADNIAAIGGAAGAAHGLGQALNSFGGADIPTQTYRGGANLDYVAQNVPSMAPVTTETALPEIVVNGTRGGLSLGQIAGIGAGAAGAGALLSGGGSGLQSTTDPVKSFGNAQTGGNAGQLAQDGGIEGGAGTGGGGMGGFGGASGGWTDWLDELIDVGGALYSGNAAKDAGKTQAAAAAAALAEQRRQYDQNREDLKPYREAGSTAIGQLSTGTADGGDFNRDFTAADFVKDPGYQFRMDEGRNAVEGSRAASTGIQNGRTLAELTRYGQNYASGEYSNAYNRFNNDRTTRFNRLGSIAGIGQTATNTGVAAGSNSVNNISDLTLEQANAKAAGRIGEANAYTSGAESLANFWRNRKYGGANTNWIGG